MKLVLTDQYANIFLLINGLAIIFYIGAKKKGKQRAMKFGNYETLQKVAGRNFLKTSNIILVTRLLALTLLVIGISQPVIEKEVPTAKSDYVLTMDVSSSMLSSDIEPNRFRASKRISQQFVGQLGNETAVGVVSFSGSVNKDQEMTKNKQRVRQSIENIEIGRKAGTAIGDALSVSTSMLVGNERPGKVVLITDGRKNVGGPIEEAVDLAVKQNITINTIGIGERNRSIDQYQIVDGQNASQAIYPNLDTEQLSNIANRTGGEFVVASNKTALRSALISVEQTKKRNDISRLFILAAAAILLFEWIISNTKFNVIP